MVAVGTSAATMKLLCVVLYISVIAISAAKQSSCHLDHECRERFGHHCFCVNPPGHQSGECECNMDPNIIIDCHKDSHCDTDQGTRRCYCKKKSLIFPTGKCTCFDILPPPNSQVME